MAHVVNCSLLVAIENYFNLEDLAVEHNMVPPVFLPAAHPWPNHVAVLCNYAGVSALGGGQSDVDARIAAARQVWLDLGHLITVDPRYFLQLSHNLQRKSLVALAIPNIFSFEVRK